jgi:hypothetical protein
MENNCGARYKDVPGGWNQNTHSGHHGVAVRACPFLLRRLLLPQQVIPVILTTLPGMHHDTWMNPDFVFCFTKKEDYFFRRPAAASRTTPIAAMMVAIPTGAFVWIGYGVCTGVAGAVFAGTRVCTCVWAGTFAVCCTAAVCAIVAPAVGAVVVPPLKSEDPFVGDDEPGLPPIWWMQ